MTGAGTVRLAPVALGSATQAALVLHSYYVHSRDRIQLAQPRKESTSKYSTTVDELHFNCLPTLFLGPEISSHLPAYLMLCRECFGSILELLSKADMFGLMVCDLPLPRLSST